MKDLNKKEIDIHNSRCFKKSKVGIKMKKC